jgi:hypothetical protein
VIEVPTLLNRCEISINSNKNASKIEAAKINVMQGAQEGIMADKTRSEDVSYTCIYRCACVRARARARVCV